MEVAIEILAVALLIGFSAIYSGSEIGFYSVSVVQVDLDAQSGSRRARLMRWLLRDESALLITILVGNNLALELATHVAESLSSRAFGQMDAGSLAIVVTLVLTPIVFLFGEALPKDIVRQRPHALTGLAVPLIALSRVAFYPLERALRLATLALERMLGLESSPVQPAAGKDAVLSFLAEGRRHGVLSESAEALASNALRLRTLTVDGAMVPWGEAQTLDRGGDVQAQFERLRLSRYSRLPVLASSWDPAGRELRTDQVEGYVHQLEVLHNWAAGGHPGSMDPFDRIRPLPAFERELTVDRALARFRASGRRIALVGEGERVLGLLSVNDLLDRISDEVVG